MRAGPASTDVRMTISTHGTVTVTPAGRIVIEGFTFIGTVEEALAEVREYLREIVADDAKWDAHVAPADPAIEPAP